MSQQDIEQIELSIAECTKMVERGQAAEKLARNPLFKKIVLEGYFVEEAARLALLSSDPAIPEEVRAFVMRDLAGPGAFKRYLSAQVQLGHQAANDIKYAHETLDDIRGDEFDEGDS